MKTILNIIFLAIISASFSPKKPELLPGQNSGAFFLFISTKENVAKGIQISVDSVKSSVKFELSAVEILRAIEGEEMGIKPIKFFMVKVEKKKRKIVPVTASESGIIYDFSKEKKEEMLKYVKGFVKGDSISVELTEPAGFFTEEMFFNILKK